MTTKQILYRIAFSLAVGILLSWAINELTFLVLNSDQLRAPKTIQLIIPAGTALKVSQGQSQPSIPANMVFVVGDILIVKNEDTSNHQLGPLFIPAGTSASLSFGTAEKYSYACSFVPGNYLGLDVQLAVTPTIRFTGAIFSGIPLGALIALYGFILNSTKKKKAAA